MQRMNLMIALKASFALTLTHGSKFISEKDFLTELYLSQTKLSEDEKEECLCKGQLGRQSLIFSYPNHCAVNLNICKSCALIIRESASPKTIQMIDFTKMVHLHGASGIFAGYDTNSGDLTFRIRDPRSRWLQQMLQNPLGIKIDVSNEGKKVSLIVGASTGKYLAGPGLIVQSTKHTFSAQYV